MRASELAAAPDNELLEISTAQGPGHSTAPELEAQDDPPGGARRPATAAFVREAARVCAERGLLA